MTRSKKPAATEDLMDFIARLPWWAGAGLAVASFALLHWLAAPDGDAQPAAASAMAMHAMTSGLVTVGQYVVPLVFLALAAISFSRRRNAEEPEEAATQFAKGDALEGMSGHELESLLREGFRLQGFQVLEAGASKPVDMVLTKGAEKYLVHCSKWRASKLGLDAVRDLHGAMGARGAVGGFVITSGSFTGEALEFANSRNVRLIDGPRLHKLIQQTRARKGPSA